MMAVQPGTPLREQRTLYRGRGGVPCFYLASLVADGNRAAELPEYRLGVADVFLQLQGRFPDWIRRR
jgi:hypothetical protein